jgi:hypothetical protein
MAQAARYHLDEGESISGSGHDVSINTTSRLALIALKTNWGRGTFLAGKVVENESDHPSPVVPRLQCGKRHPFPHMPSQLDALKREKLTVQAWFRRF